MLPQRSVLICLGLMISAPLAAWAGLELGAWGLPGVRVAGAPLPARGSALSALQRRAQQWGAESLTLHVGYHWFQPQRSELGWGLQVQDAERALHALGRSPNPLVSWREMWIAWFAGGHELDWRPRAFAAGALRQYVDQVRDEVERLPISGSLAADGTLIAGLPGEAFDVVAARRAIERALVRGAAEVVISTLVTPPPAGVRRFDANADGSTIAMYAMETRYAPGTGRATNIALAARQLNGTVLPPGAAFSFNASVGKRERARGFAPALELVRGELTLGIGGGVCQVAGTLHAAAFYAGLIVDEYHAHSRLNRLAYLAPGLDAMVAWPEDVTELRATQDMRLRNPYPFPIRIAATIAGNGGQNVLRVELWGAARPYRVDFRFHELERVPAPEVQRADNRLPRGETRVQQQALAGLTIARQRTIHTPLGRVLENTRISYPPTPRIVLIGTK